MYCTKAMFDVEYFLFSLGKSLDLDRDKEGYYKYTRYFLLHIGIKDDNKFQILNAPAKIRNCLHNNGYYANDDFEITLRGRSYKFVKGKQVEFTGWDNLYIFFDELLKVLTEIVDNPVIQKIDKIPHTSMYYQKSG
jgi:hypothetical protein